MRKGCEWSFRNRHEIWKTMESQKTPKGRRMGLQDTPEHPCLDGRFQYSLASCLSLIILSALFSSLSPASLSFSPHIHDSSSLGRKGGTELSPDQTARQLMTGWLALKVVPDLQDLSRQEQLPEEKLSFLESGQLSSIPLLGIFVPSSQEETENRLNCLQSFHFCSWLTYTLA